MKNMSSILKKVLVATTLLCLLTATGVIASDNSISGVVEQTDQGYVITADDGQEYIVSGKDLSALVGQKVQVTGTLAEDEAGKTITIDHIEPAKK